MPRPGVEHCEPDSGKPAQRGPASHGNMTVRAPSRRRALTICPHLPSPARYCLVDCTGADCTGRSEPGRAPMVAYGVEIMSTYKALAALAASSLLSLLTLSTAYAQSPAADEKQQLGNSAKPDVRSRHRQADVSQGERSYEWPIVRRQARIPAHQLATSGQRRPPTEVSNGSRLMLAT